MEARTWLLVLVVAISLSASGASAAEIYSGSLTSDDDGLDGIGLWADPGSTLSWTVTENPGISWHYEYTLTVASKDISHILFEVSDAFAAGDYSNASHGNDAIGDYGTDNGNPDIPSTVHGLKFDETEGTTLIISFDSIRVPVWGDFYAKDGKQAGDIVQLWNTGLTAADTDPTDAPASGTVSNHVLVPDTYVPEPVTMSILAFGGLALLCRRRR